MPAVTADTVALPRLPSIALDAVQRPVVSVTTAPSGFEGEGFPVRRAFAGVDLAALDPFVHMDQMGEVDYAPGEPKGRPLAPPPRVRDRHLRDRRDLPPPCDDGRAVLSIQ
jgi:quercetin 2,3-dioxygenase